MSHEASGSPLRSIQAAVDDALRFDLRSAFDVLHTLAGMPDGEGEGEGNSGEGSGSGGDEGTGSSGAGDEGAGEGTNTDDVKNPKLKALSDEAAQHRVKAKELQEALDRANTRLKEIDDKDKSELEKAQSDAAELKSKLETAQETVKEQAVKLAFFESGAAAQFRSPARALVLLRDDLKDITPDEDGKVDAKAIKEKADALLKSDPYLKAEGGEEEEEGGDGSSETPSGRQTNGRRSKSELDQEALKSKFPALRR